MSKTQPQRDPYGIVPDSFWELYDSIEEARHNAESATDPDEMKRCPADGCATINISRRSSKPNSSAEYAWKCNRCGHRFETPRDSVNDELGSQATLVEVCR